MLAELGFAIVIFSISTLVAPTAAMEFALARIKQDESPIDVLRSLPTFDEFTDLIGFPEIRQLAQNYRTS